MFRQDGDVPTMVAYPPLHNRIKHFLFLYWAVVVVVVFVFSGILSNETCCYHTKRRYFGETFSSYLFIVKLCFNLFFSIIFLISCLTFQLRQQGAPMTLPTQTKLLSPWWGMVAFMICLLLKILRHFSLFTSSYTNYITIHNELTQRVQYPHCHWLKYFESLWMIVSLGLVF